MHPCNTSPSQQLTTLIDAFCLYDLLHTTHPMLCGSFLMHSMAKQFSHIHLLHFLSHPFVHVATSMSAVHLPQVLPQFELIFIQPCILIKYGNSCMQRWSCCGFSFKFCCCCFCWVENNLLQIHLCQTHDNIRYSNLSWYGKGFVCGFYAIEIILWSK